MVIHQREIRYKANYAEFFNTLLKLKEREVEKFPEIPVELIYNLAGERGCVIIQKRYPSLAEYERIDAELDKDEELTELYNSIVTTTGVMPVDQFYRVIGNE